MSTSDVIRIGKWTVQCRTWEGGDGLWEATHMIDGAPNGRCGLTRAEAIAMAERGAARDAEWDKAMAAHRPERIFIRKATRREIHSLTARAIAYQSIPNAPAGYEKAYAPYASTGADAGFCYRLKRTL